MFQLEWPWVLLFAPLPFLVYWLVPRANIDSAAIKVPFFYRVQSILVEGQIKGNALRSLKLSILILIWCLTVFAAAKPQWLGDPIALPTSGRDLLVAVDLSGSMETADMVIGNEQFRRIDIVKYVVGEFLERRESDRLGLILFGSNAYLQAPLTFDRKTVNRFLQEAQLKFAGPKTAIGDAIGLAIKRLKDRPASQRVLILLTDGENTAGVISPIDAANTAKQAGIKIYTVGVGADPSFNRFSMNFGRSELDEKTLKYIADTTGGQYFRAQNPKELSAIYSRMDELEPIEQEKETFRPIVSLFFWPLGVAFMLSILTSVLKLFRVVN